MDDGMLLARTHPSDSYPPEVRLNKVGSAPGLPLQTPSRNDRRLRRKPAKGGKSKKKGVTGQGQDYFQYDNSMESAYGAGGTVIPPQRFNNFVDSNQKVSMVPGIPEPTAADMALHRLLAPLGQGVRGYKP
jgi:hypothetical protein